MQEESNFKKGTVVLSFDDGNADDFRLYENILSKHKISATFNIESGAIGQPGRLTREQLSILHSDPLMEIAGHGYSHKNDDADIRKDIETLSGWLDIPDGKIGFASPNSGMKNKFIADNEAHLRAMGLIYVRTNDNPYPSKRHLEIQNELTEQKAREYVIRNVPQLTYCFNGLCINSAVVLHTTEVDDLTGLTDLAAKEKACVVFLFHRVKKPGEYKYDDEYSYDYHQFAEFAEYLDQKRQAGAIDILTTKQAFFIGK